MPLLSCPHCGSALAAPTDETSPMRCPVCGALLGANATSATLPIREAIVREEDDSATRPVEPERMAPIIAQATADHRNAQFAEAQSAIVRPADETTQALPFTPTPTSDAHDVTQELPPTALPQQPESPARRAREGAVRAASLALVALALIAIVVVAALVANGILGRGATTATQASATATSVPSTPTPPPALSLFHLPGLYQVSYPQDWIIQQRNAPPKGYFALLTASSGGASVNIEAQQAKSMPTLADLDQQFLNALAQPGTTPTPDGSASSVSVAGQEWTQLTADIALHVPDGQPEKYARVIALSAQHGAYVYTIVCLAPSASAAAAEPAFTTANTTYFQPLLASFSFDS